MFSKKNQDDAKNNGSVSDQDASGNDKDIVSPPLKPFSKKGAHVPAKPPTGKVGRANLPRRSPAMPGQQNRAMDRSRSIEADSKTLLVGRDIRLNGEITACEHLIVQGQVEATLKNARLIEVATTGFFDGHADVTEADIDGRFEGELIARKKLIVRAGGRIKGTIRYGSIVIEAGGEISGDMATLDSE